MSFSHPYGGAPPRRVVAAVLEEALNSGVTLFDTAALYGFGANESLFGELMAFHRERIVLATKCGMTLANGQRVIDGRPDSIRSSCEASLRRLRTESIDLLYLHRLDPTVPIEDSVGAMADLSKDGKVRAIGLLEVSAETLRRAHAVHPIAAVQSEYSLATRNPEIGVLDVCRELGVAFVASSPLARGWLCGEVRRRSALAPQDIRRTMPRFSQRSLRANRLVLDVFVDTAAQLGCAPATLAVAWLLHQDECVIPIPGTSRPDHVWELAVAPQVHLDEALLQRLDALINHETVRGARYSDAAQAEVDTEQFFTERSAARFDGVATASGVSAQQVND